MLAQNRARLERKPADTGMALALHSQPRELLISLFGIINGTGLPMFDAETKSKRELVDTLMRRHDTDTLQLALFEALYAAVH